MLASCIPPGLETTVAVFLPHAPDDFVGLAEDAGDVSQLNDVVPDDQHPILARGAVVVRLEHPVVIPLQVVSAADDYIVVAVDLVLLADNHIVVIDEGPFDLFQDIRHLPEPPVKLLSIQ